jgi:hypothetical protein
MKSFNKLERFFLSSKGALCVAPLGLASVLVGNVRLARKNLPKVKRSSFPTNAAALFYSFSLL